MSILPLTHYYYLTFYPILVDSDRECLFILVIYIDSTQGDRGLTILGDIKPE